MKEIMEEVKHAADVASMWTLAGVLAGILPSIATLLTILWMAIRIYESDTVQKLLGRKPIEKSSKADNEQL